MRATGDVACRPLWLWRTGMLDLLPDCIDPLIVDVAHDSHDRRDRTADAGRRANYFVPEGSGLVPLEQHHRFIDHMAALHAAFWNWQGPADLMPLANRYTVLAPTDRTGRGRTRQCRRRPVDAGCRCGSNSRVVAPELGELALAVDEPSPSALVDALAETPTTLVHGDWKAGNLGSRPDGRTILVDWAVARSCYRAASTWAGTSRSTATGCRSRRRRPSRATATPSCRHGIDVGDWFDRQLELALLGAFVQLGWSKTERSARTCAGGSIGSPPTARDLLR